MKTKVRNSRQCYNGTSSLIVSRVALKLSPYLSRSNLYFFFLDANLFGIARNGNRSKDIE